MMCLHVLFISVAVLRLLVQVQLRGFEVGFAGGYTRSGVFRSCSPLITKQKVEMERAVWQEQ